MPGVLIVEDNRHYRAELVRFLESSRLTELTVAWAPDAESALRIARTFRPAFVTVDFSIGESTTLELTAALRAALPESAIILLSAHTERAFAEAAARAGADKLVGKDDAPEALLPALFEARRARQGAAEAAGPRSAPAVVPRAGPPRPSARANAKESP
jgi:ActR/RegA family two-component response regulator